MRTRRFLLFCFLVQLLLGAEPFHQVFGGEVTLITHGLNGNVDGWVTGMSDRVPQYPGVLDTNYTCYKVYLYASGSTWLPAAVRSAGSPPTSPKSGEIVVKLDWSGVANGNSWNTYQVANTFAPVLLSTNFIAELGGHALAELPLHLVGHSRGGSLICELSRLLGTNGVWVDHLTTLDPHPLNNDGFNADAIFYSAKDAPAHTYQNVLFHDNYWQHIDSIINGEPVAGAYVRKLSNLSGGNSSAHSDVHLWYHGTVDGRTPTGDTDPGSIITSAERTNWWVTSEAMGTNAGFRYSLIGQGDRLSSLQPLGGTNAAIRDGFNQFWDLGAGTAANRTTLTTNYGNWPSLIRLNRLDTNQVTQSQNLGLTFYYQWANPGIGPANIALYLDDDLNPWNGNEQLLTQMNGPVTGAGSIGKGTISAGLSNAPAGSHFLFARISGNGRTRYLYAPEPVTILPDVPPGLAIARIGSRAVVLTVSGSTGQTMVLDANPDLNGWEPVATNRLAASPWRLTNNVDPQTISQFYRVRRVD
jgi:hypothetical protein